MDKNLIKNLFNNKNKKTFIIAEIGNNHNGSLKLAKKMIIAAKKNGADCVKFQTFSTNSLFSKKSFVNNIKLKKDSDKYTLKLNDFKILRNFSKKNKIEFSATPFSRNEVDFLIDDLKLNFIKIASMDINNYPLIEYIAKKKIPIVLSTGFGSKDEIIKAVKIIKKQKSKLIVLHCVSNYPPKNSELNLNRISTLEKILKVPIGFSDHTIGTDIPFAAISIGAKVIEKHFTLNKKMKGWDHSISANPHELNQISNFSKKIFESKGSKDIYRVESKTKTEIFRRSIVASKKILKNTKIKLADLNFKRPGNGLSPEHIKKIVGKYSKRTIFYDDQILLRDIKNSKTI